MNEDLSCEWVDAVDRGGLIHISDNLYLVFVSIELEVRFFRVEKVKELNIGKIASTVL